MNKSWTPLSRLLASGRATDTPVALHSRTIYQFGDFQGSVAKLQHQLARRKERCWALYCEEAYPFAVALFALLHADKEVWIPSNNTPGTRAALQQEGVSFFEEWPKNSPPNRFETESAISLLPLDPKPYRLVVYTSGSTGQPKAIKKRLLQLDNEVATLEATWGTQLGTARILGTVSHQHIYGLLFRVLWPLAAGRTFYSNIFRDPKNVILEASREPTAWIGSPAHLKRLQPGLPWEKTHQLRMIFSSGGPLPRETALQLLENTGQTLVEVYGSSESGGIAWRRQTPDQGDAWTPLAGVEIARGKGGSLRLRSPYLPNMQWVELEDSVELLDRGLFRLGARLDRIVKIEEKRLSLPELELRLETLKWLKEAHALVLPGRRLILAVVAVLNQAGRALLEKKGKRVLALTLREELLNWFESVCLPRKWCFVKQLPLNSQGKIDRREVLKMFESSKKRLPQLLGQRTGINHDELKLKIDSDLSYFTGHFSELPILPGVAQLYWVECYGRELMGITSPFSRMESIKFKKLIHPEDQLILNLNWEPQNGQLHFSYHSDRGEHSSGRLVYGVENG